MLELENMDRPKRALVRVGPCRTFSITYIHSIYDAPTTEEFLIEDGLIVLKGIRTSNPGVMEYYGFDSVTEYHPRHRELGEFSLRVKMGDGQTLVCDDQRLPLEELGDRGDRIRLRVVTRPLVPYLIWTRLRGILAYTQRH